MGTYAPYGYIKDPADHNHLLIDDKVAHIVREIFDLALAETESPKSASTSTNSTSYALPLMRRSRGRQVMNGTLRITRKTVILEREQREGHFKKPYLCGKPCRLQADCRQHEKQETPSKLPEEWEVIPTP